VTGRWWSRVPGTLVCAGALWMLRAGSLAPLRVEADTAARLRLSWSARPERIEKCRRLSDAELAERPQHMRLRWECEGQFARYLLSVAVDGRPLASDTVRGDGLRHDRPMHLFREFALMPGTRHVSISLRRIDAAVRPDSATDAATANGSAAADRATREGQERRVRRAEALPEFMALDTTLHIAAQRVLLVSYDDAVHHFVLR